MQVLQIEEVDLRRIRAWRKMAPDACLETWNAMAALHQLTRMLMIVMITGISTLAGSLAVALVTVGVVATATQTLIFTAVAVPVTLFLLSPYAILLRRKSKPFRTLRQEWIGLGSSVLLIGISALLLLRLLRVPNVPFVGAISVGLSPFLFGAVQLVVAWLTIEALRRLEPEGVVLGS